MTEGRLTIRFDPAEMATIERLSAALNVSKTAVVKLAIAKLSEGKDSDNSDAQMAQLNRSLLRSMRLLWFARDIKDREKLEQVDAQLLEIWKHVTSGQ